MKIPSFVWIILVLVIGFGGLIVLVNNKNNQIYANIKLPVEMEVFVDYNCPHCAEFEPEIAKMRNTYGDKINIVKKNLTLTSNFGPTSLTYAYAAEAARLQGDSKFNVYSDDLFKWNTYLRDPNNTIYTYSDDEKNLFKQGNIDVDKLAQFVGLDVAKFDQDRNSDDVKNTVTAQTADATQRLGAPSTPAIFAFGQHLTFNTFDEFEGKISDLVSAAEKNSK